MKIALLGGSFDPVHLGHLMIADAAQVRFGYDLVVFVPTAVSPHKKGADPESADDRLAMLNAALLGQKRFLVDDCELRRSGVSYTIDTIADIERRYVPDGKIGLILGEDLIAGFPAWKRVDELVSRVDIVLAARPGFSGTAFGYPHALLGNVPVDIASSGIRKLIAQREPWRYLVPAETRQIIEARGLYGAVASAASAPEDLCAAVDRFASAELSCARYLHSRGVAVLAADLCARNGLDPARGYLAGIAHDICKEMSAERIVSLAVMDGRPLGEVERAKPSLLHARAAANFLESRFACRDSSVLDAIRHHTFGECGMDDLAKAVYVADKLEPSRESVSRDLRVCCKTDGLRSVFKATLEDTVRYLRERGKLVSEHTERLLAECGEVENESGAHSR